MTNQDNEDAELREKIEGLLAEQLDYIEAQTGESREPIIDRVLALFHTELAKREAEARADQVVQAHNCMWSCRWAWAWRFADNKVE